MPDNVSTTNLSKQPKETPDGDEQDGKSVATKPSDTSKITQSAKEPSIDEESIKLPERKKWDSQMEFLMSCISMSVGLGNVWRFPINAYENGGGAFLIPYLIVLVFMGWPIYFLELTLGQFSGYSHVEAWNLAPICRGIGHAAMIATVAVQSYYVSIIALTVYYFFASFQKNLPWAHCDTAWAGKGMCKGSASAFKNQSVSEMYFYHGVIKEAENIDQGIGAPDWKLVLCLLLSWILIFATIIRGVHSSGKVAYFTAIFPYAVLIILLIQGLTLPGMGKGIEYFVKPNFTKLKDPGVWYAATSQCFFSLNTGFGSIISFSSHNTFNHNIYRDSIIVSFMDTFTSLLAGFTIFAVLGNLAYEQGVPVEKVVKGGSGLAFVSYPDAIAKFKGAPQLFAVLFFLMLFTLGHGSSVSDVGALATICCDRFPKLVRWRVTLALCCCGFAVGLVYTTPGGQFILDLVDFYGGGFVIYYVSVMEVIGIAWIYGVFNYVDDIEFMLGYRLSWYWKISWGFSIPIFLTIILVYSVVVDSSIEHNDVPYPVIAQVFGWLLAFMAILSLPVGGIQAMRKVRRGSCCEKFVEAFRPNADWGPRNPEKREEWLAFKQTHPHMSFVERIRERKL